MKRLQFHNRNKTLNIPFQYWNSKNTNPWRSIYHKLRVYPKSITIKVNAYIALLMNFARSFFICFNDGM